MFERFTDRCRKAMALANQEAQRLGHDHIGNEHVFLALAKEGSGVGAHALRRLGVDLTKLRREIEAALKAGAGSGAFSKLPQTPAAKATIMYAMEEARNLGHNYVGTEHLLLGLLRESGGLAEVVLGEAGVGLEKVRMTVHEILDEREASKELSHGQRPAGSSGPLEVVNATLCSRVVGYGQYDPLPEPIFPAGQAGSAVLYLEVEGVGHSRTADGQWDVLMKIEVSLLAPNESWNLSGRTVSATTRRKRRDIFLAEEIRLSANLSPGWYSLRVLVVDMIANQQATATSTFQVRPGG